MSFSIEKLPDEPIIICTIEPGFDPWRDFPAFWAQLDAAIAGLPGPIYRINQFKREEVNFSNLLAGLAEETRSGKPGSAADPRIRFLAVSRSALREMTRTSFLQEQYGHITIHIFDAVETALAHARAELAQGHARTG